MAHQVLLQVLGGLDRLHQVPPGVAQPVQAPGLLGLPGKGSPADEGDDGAEHGLEPALVLLVQVEGGHLGRPAAQDLPQVFGGKDLRGFQPQDPGDQSQGVLVHPGHLVAHRLHGGAGEVHRGPVEVPRLGGGGFGHREPAAEHPHEPPGKGREEADPQEVEEGVEGGELEHVVVGGDAQGPGGGVHQPHQGAQEGHGHGTGDDVEEDVGGGEALAVLAGAHCPQDRRDGGPQVGPDGEGDGVLVGDLVGRERRDGEHQGRVAGLHHHRGDEAQGGEEQDPPEPRHGEPGQVEAVADPLEPLLHVVDAEEEKAEPGQDVPRPLEGLGLLEHQHHPEHQHRHGVGGDIDLEAEAGHQPRPRGGPEVRPKDDPDARPEAQEPGAQEGYGDHRNQRARLEQGGGHQPEGDALPGPVGGAPQDAFEGAPGEGPEALLQGEHAEEEDRHPGGHGGEARARPQAVGEEQQGNGKQGLSQHRLLGSPRIGYRGGVLERPGLTVRGSRTRGWPGSGARSRPARSRARWRGRRGGIARRRNRSPRCRRRRRRPGGPPPRERGKRAGA